LKTVATIEARMTSTRLPGKVLADLHGQPMLARLIERVRRARRVDQVVVATTVNATDDPVAALAAQLEVGCHRGSEEDVLARVLGAAQAYGGDLIVELTGDNPLVEPLIIDAMVDYYRAGGFDYVANTAMRHAPAWGEACTFPVGTSVEIFSTALLAQVEQWTNDPIDREHVSSFIFERPERFKLGAFKAEGPFAGCRRPDIRLTVDRPADLDLVRAVFTRLYPANPDFTLMDVVDLLTREPELLASNHDVVQTRVFEQRVQT
jgi:spore coat polysaccharide biosynthesis protein SpsF